MSDLLYDKLNCKRIPANSASCGQKQQHLPQFK